RGLTESQGSLRYAPDKWSIKQMLQHVIDAERVFAYRALRAARGDRTPLPGFEENEYAAQAEAQGRTMRSLIDELETLRRANVAMFGALSEEELKRRTIANQQEISVRASAYLVAGRGRHHERRIRERYLPSSPA